MESGATLRGTDARDRPGGAPGRSAGQAAPGGSLARYLLGFALVLLVPAIGLGAVAAWQSIRASQQEFTNRLQGTTTALALALDRDIERLMVVARGLAALPAMREGDAATLTALHGWAKQFAVDAGAENVSLHDTSGSRQQLLNTRLPPGAPLPATPGEEVGRLIARAVERGETGISNLFTGRASGQYRIAIAAPVWAEGRVVRVVLIILTPDRLSALLARLAAAPGGAALADATGRMVARSARAERFVGRPMPAFFAGAAGQAEGLLRGINSAGVETVFGFRHLQQAPGWVLMAGEPAEALRELWRGPLLWLASGALAAMLLGAIAAWRLGIGILRPIAALRREANAVAAGRPDALTAAPASPSGIREFAELRQALVRAHAALQAGEKRLRLAIEAARFSTWEYDTRRGLGSRQGELTSRLPYLPETGVGLEAWLGAIHPADRPAAEQAIRATLAGTQEGFALEFRVAAPGGGWLWVVSHGTVVEREAGNGQVLRIAGVAQDVTAIRAAAERQALLARELDHRAKNALAVVQAALRLTPKSDAASYAKAVEGRVRALARAHDLLAESRWLGADLRRLLEAELVPFLGGPGGGEGVSPRVELRGPEVALPPAAAQPISMALHELATNAMKYGALSVPDGQVALSWQQEKAAGVLRLRWAEQGGPALEGEPGRRGFGTRVVEATVVGQLGGSISREWRPEGLCCEMVIPLRGVAGE
ncbi:HWE histidine kinase domain-containing protein [Siccirubricoccus phaeus]|uniref:HWE histidine kinase domain-containing protein n=1 Tax=Siccirubricoccus phaeus TaxID=2595053 RepID=UPI0011F3B0B5|nr:HWE histidine kinase domain-containing protein [Siccirubricoccus phaeus]